MRRRALFLVLSSVLCLAYAVWMVRGLDWRIDGIVGVNCPNEQGAHSNEPRNTTSCVTVGWLVVVPSAVFASAFLAHAGVRAR